LCTHTVKIEVIYFSKSDAKLQKNLDPEEPVHPPPSIQKDPSAASSSQAVPPSDEILRRLDQMSARMESLHDFWRE
jgi:hypothetical protein